MNKVDYVYEDALRQIMSSGIDRGDRTGTGTRSLFGLQMRWDLNDGFPLVTTKQVFTRPMVEELLWFLSGDTNNNTLKAKNIKIWDAWADPETGELGPIYSKQWRSWEGKTQSGASTTTDQIFNVIKDIRTTPESRRHVVSAWNVSQINDMALAPCHCLFQFWVADGKLSCQLYQRSADFFLGVPFNIASYSLLTHMVAQQCDLGVGEFIWTGGDCHVYKNHFDQVNTQLGRYAYPKPALELNKAASIFDYQLSDVVFHNYQHHPVIRGEVAV